MRLLLLVVAEVVAEVGRVAHGVEQNKPPVSMDRESAHESARKGERSAQQLAGGRVADAEEHGEHWAWWVGGVGREGRGRGFREAHTHTATSRTHKLPPTSTVRKPTGASSTQAERTSVFCRTQKENHPVGTEAAL